MRVQVDDARDAFKPITITIEITSRDELAALWHRLDVGISWLVKRYDGSANPKVAFPNEWGLAPKGSPDSTEELFKAVDALAVNRGLRTGGAVGH